MLCAESVRSDGDIQRGQDTGASRAFNGTPQSQFSHTTGGGYDETYSQTGHHGKFCYCTELFLCRVKSIFRNLLCVLAVLCFRSCKAVSVAWGLLSTMSHTIIS